MVCSGCRTRRVPLLARPAVPDASNETLLGSQQWHPSVAGESSQDLRDVPLTLSSER